MQIPKASENTQGFSNHHLVKTYQDDLNILPKPSALWLEAQRIRNTDEEVQVNKEDKRDDNSASLLPRFLYHHLILVFARGRRDVAPRSRLLALLQISIEQWFSKYGQGTSNSTAPPPWVFVGNVDFWMLPQTWGGVQ